MMWETEEVVSKRLMSWSTTGRILVEQEGWQRWYVGCSLFYFVLEITCSERHNSVCDGPPSFIPAPPRDLDMGSQHSVTLLIVVLEIRVLNIYIGPRG